MTAIDPPFAGAPSSGPLLVIRGLGRMVGEKSLVAEINLEVAAGEVLAISGPSGSGKTSLLRLINRLDEPTTGHIELAGVDCRSCTPRELRRRVGMVSQAPYLFAGTVGYNIRFGPEQHGETMDDRAVDQLLESVGLSGYRDRLVHQLSGGEAQRVALARTLANSPRALLLDEPTSSLDDDAREAVEKLIVGIVREKGLPCLLVSHDRSQIRRVARRVLVLKEGREVRLGPVEEVLNASAAH